mmetsp:Transcript_7512/g.11377  ORF Transcript_7512/g.11377 Transcript_7512/m.11377 type:complete len:481 (+) Transcript_7512:90-1532(+)|eukprot:CAMPEP_0167760834 /NCGR_PEP_ID=MMETSP0110_2-20121227/11812_1 /TAXON_ID=629695 /ORGANISM="Gymnochlora sp., Strain CCMP2014" /LENGTH=480 /DNA_ID=CAMNT_0007647401 /DNA_START=21 /DNA_END=1463 /DNA_ORIENTATION=-
MDEKLSKRLPLESKIFCAQQNNAPYVSNSSPFNSELSPITGNKLIDSQSITAGVEEAETSLVTPLAEFAEASEMDTKTLSGLKNTHPRDADSAEDNVRKKRKKSKDPSAPKNPLSAYLFFVVKQRSDMSKSDSELTFAEMAKKIGRKWREMTSEEKRPYVQLAEFDKMRYEKEKEQYNQKVEQSRTIEVTKSPQLKPPVNVVQYPSSSSSHYNPMNMRNNGYVMPSVPSVPPMQAMKSNSPQFAFSRLPHYSMQTHSTSTNYPSPYLPLLPPEMAVMHSGSGANVVKSQSQQMHLAARQRQHQQFPSMPAMGLRMAAPIMHMNGVPTHHYSISDTSTPYGHSMPPHVGSAPMMGMGMVGAGPYSRHIGETRFTGVKYGVNSKPVPMPVIAGAHSNSALGGVAAADARMNSNSFVTQLVTQHSMMPPQHAVYHPQLDVESRYGDSKDRSSNFNRRSVRPNGISFHGSDVNRNHVDGHRRKS